MGHAGHGVTPQHSEHGSAAADAPPPSDANADEHAAHGGGDAAQDADAGEHAAHGAAASTAEVAEHTSHQPARTAAIQSHLTSERNRGVDMQASTPTARLADPGVGLRDNGRRVLTYADLRTPSGDPDGREPGRTVELHLTGHMERFVWSFDGIPFSGAEPIVLEHGERVRFVLVNDTMMDHPIHLHGMWSDLENEAGEFQVRKHTILVPPGTRRSVRVTADALGP